MKYSAAVLAFAAGVMATGNVTVTTEVVDKIVTYCPGATEITHGSKTYTVTEATTLTITDCPCTITKPVVPTSSVICNDCPAPSAPPAAPPAPPANNGTVPGAPAPTGSNPAPTTPGAPAPTSPPTAGAAKVAGLSGLAGLAGIAAYFL